MFSVGKFSWPEGIAVSDSALAALERSVAAETDDQILAGIVKSAFSLLQQDTAQEPRVVALIAAALSRGDEYALHAASEVLGLHAGELTVTLLDTLLVHLLRGNPANKGTLVSVQPPCSLDFRRGAERLPDVADLVGVPHGSVCSWNGST